MLAEIQKMGTVESVVLSFAAIAITALPFFTIAYLIVKRRQ